MVEIGILENIAARACSCTKVAPVSSLFAVFYAFYLAKLPVLNTRYERIYCAQISPDFSICPINFCGPSESVCLSLRPVSILFVKVENIGSAVRDLNRFKSAVPSQHPCGTVMSHNFIGQARVTKAYPYHQASFREVNESNKLRFTDEIIPFAVYTRLLR